MKVSAKDIPFIKKNLHLTDEHLGNIFGVTAGGMKQARRKFELHKEQAKFKPGHPYHPFVKYVPKRRSKYRTIRVNGNFELKPHHRGDLDYWLKLII